MSIRILFGILIIGSFFISMSLQYFFRKKYYKKNLRPETVWLDKRLLLTLFTPRDYIESENFWKGYLLYLISILFLVLALVLFYIWLDIRGVSG